jgi:amino acid transporter
VPYVLAALAAVAVAAWSWWIARGRAQGRTKRLAFRATLVALLAAVVAIASRYGVFARSTFGFRVALLLAICSVLLGYLYAVRFCPACGRMQRNLKPAACVGCGAPLPRHGMTARLRRAPTDAPDGSTPFRQQRR